MEERRLFKRYPVYCPLEFKPYGLPRDRCITVNLSEAGALISTSKNLNISDQMIIRIIIKEQEFFLRARVVHIQDERTPGLYGVGVEFVEQPKDFVGRFYEELETLMLYRRRLSEEAGSDISLTEASTKWYRNSPIWL
jgi:hypothetical protein